MVIQRKRPFCGRELGNPDDILGKDIRVTVSACKLLTSP
jgi:hypothetical protein